MPNDTSFLKKAFRRHEIQIAAIVVLMAIFFSALSPGFLSVSNLTTLLESYSVMAIMAAGLSPTTAPGSKPTVGHSRIHTGAPYR